MAAFYVPSGKYPDLALHKLFVASFCASAISGLLYGASIIGFGFFPFTETCIGLLMSVFVIIFAGKATQLTVKKLKIRSPKPVRTVATVACLAGWSFNWLVIYLLSATSNGWLSFMYDRYTNGILIQLLVGVGDPIHFILSGKLLALAWLLEALLVPVYIGLLASKQSGLPFSEIKQSWFKQVRLSPAMYDPVKSVALESLKGKDVSFLAEANPARYEGGCWASLYLFIPDFSSCDKAYVKIMDNGLGKLFPEFFPDEIFAPYYWEISDATAKQLLKKFKASNPALLTINIAFH